MMLCRRRMLTVHILWRDAVMGTYDLLKHTRQHAAEPSEQLSLLSL